MLVGIKEKSIIFIRSKTFPLCIDKLKKTRKNGKIKKEEIGIYLPLWEVYAAFNGKMTKKIGERGMSI